MQEEIENANRGHVEVERGEWGAEGRDEARSPLLPLELPDGSGGEEEEGELETWEVAGATSVLLLLLAGLLKALWLFCKFMHKIEQKIVFP